jgi:hypothetical protein
VDTDIPLEPPSNSREYKLARSFPPPAVGTPSTDGQISPHLKTPAVTIGLFQAP